MQKLKRHTFCYLISTYFSKQMVGLAASSAVILIRYQTKRQMLLHNIFITVTVIHVNTSSPVSLNFTNCAQMQSYQINAQLFVA